MPPFPHMSKKVILVLVLGLKEECIVTSDDVLGKCFLHRWVDE